MRSFYDFAASLGAASEDDNELQQRYCDELGLDDPFAGMDGYSMAFEASVEGSSGSSRTVGDFHAMQQPVVFTLHCSQGFRHATSNPPLPPSICDPSLFLDAPITTSLSSPTSPLRHDEHSEWDGLSSGSSSPGPGPSAYHAGVHSTHIGANNLQYRRDDELGGIRIGGEYMRAIATHSEVRVQPALALGTI